MIKIGEFSSLAKTTIKTLRFYDEIDLFKPFFVDDNGYRYYSIEQLCVLQKIVDLRAIDMPIDEIRQIINGKDVMTILTNHLQELSDEKNSIKNKISLINNYIVKAKKGDFMKNYQATQIVLPKCIVYYRHGTIDSMKDMFSFVLDAGEEVRKNNPTLKCSKLNYCFVVYSAKEYKEKNVELEYVEAVEEVGKESENIKFKTLKEQKAISVMHKGAYAKLREAYAFAVNYVKEKGFEIAGPIRERYINGCWDKENEEYYLTEIQIPIK